MIDRRTFVAMGAGALLAGMRGEAYAQPTAEVRRIGWLGNTMDARVQEVLSLALRERGYVEGRNLVVLRRFAEGKDERFPALAAELIGLKPDVIMSLTGPGTAAAKAATSTIPIVMVGISDPVGRGLVSKLGGPGANITGIASLNVDLYPKRLELLKAAVPKTARVASIGNSAGQEPARLAALVQSADAAAKGMDVTLVRFELNAPAEWKGVTDAIVRERPDAMILSSVAINLRLRREIAEFAAEQRLPAIGAFREQAIAGILMSYGPDYDEVIRDAVTYVDRILKGAKPGDLPVEQPTKIMLVINLKTAKALGITIPQSLLLRADEVIQ